MWSIVTFMLSVQTIVPGLMLMVRCVAMLLVLGWWWENYSLGLSMISMIEGKDESQNVAMENAKAMAMAMMVMVRMVLSIGF
jgi:hypothetical protein